MFSRIKKFFSRKRNVVISVIAALVIIAIIFMSRGGGAGSGILTDTVKKQDLKQTVLATGQVISATDLNLSFQASGVVKAVNVKVGDKVKAGKVLATLDQKNQLAALTQARGAQASAQASYDKVLAGATNEDVQVSKAAVAAAETTLSNAEAAYQTSVLQQKNLVENARLAWFNAGLSADRTAFYDTSATLTISGTYTSSGMGEYLVKLTGDGGSGFVYNISGLESEVGNLIRGTPLALGTQGLFMTFSTGGSFSSVDAWKIEVPNPKASTYLSTQNAYQAALQTEAAALVSAQNTINSARVALDQAKAALALKQAAARPEEVAAARASVLSASGQVAAAAAALENTVVRAPANGTITSVDIKVGELATALAGIIVLQDVAALHIEANLSEANIADIQAGQITEVTFDAFGSERKYQVKVLAVDPASTVVSGVVNYKVKFSLENTADIKPGMTANLVILTGEKTGVLVVPSRAITLKDGKRYIRVVTHAKAKTYEEQEITAGLEGDGGLVEVSSGLSEGQEIITFVPSK